MPSRRAPRQTALAAALLVAACVLTTAPAIASPLTAESFAAGMRRGPLYATLISFAGGLLGCLTPCVYPMIVITVSVFGARQATSRLQAMALSTAFVAGVAAMLTPLGVTAGMTGMLFGSLLSNPWVVWSVAIVFGLLAASMLGAFELVLPSSLSNRLAQVGGIGYLGAFLLGMVSGVIATPCTGPVLTGILVWIGYTRDPWLGAAVMLAFSLGLGLPFWVVGTFAIRLPKSGAWMVGIKTFFGVVLAAAALYFLRTALPALAWLTRPGTGFVLGAAAVGVVGLGVATFHATATGRSGVARKIAGSLVGAVGLFVAFASWQQAPATASAVEAIDWQPFRTEAVAQARAEHRPVLIDFTAEWCAACLELAKHTFADEAVAAEAKRFACFRLDATNDDDPAVVKAQQMFRVAGLPTVLLIDQAGQEHARVTAYTGPTDFLLLLQATR